MSSGSQLRNSSLHWRLTQVVKDLVTKAIGDAKAVNPAQKLAEDVKNLAISMSAVRKKPPEDETVLSEKVDEPSVELPDPVTAGKSWQSYMRLIKPADKPEAPVIPKWKLAEANTRVSST